MADGTYRGQATPKSAFATRPWTRRKSAGVCPDQESVHRSNSWETKLKKISVASNQNPAGTADQSKKNPSQPGGQNPNQQDPSKKNPSQGEDSRQRDGEGGSDQVEKRRAS